MAGPRAAEVLGLTATQVKDQLLAYVTAYGQQVALTTTLGQLADALTGKQLPAGRFGVLALRPAEAELNLLVDSAGGEFFSLGQDSHVVMSLQPDTDARPLYFIPYDPDLGQAPQEKAFCKRVLFERIHSSVLVAVGRAAPPVELVLEIKGLLNDAMFGMYELWESRESARHMRALCRQLMRPLAQAINTVVSGAVTYDSDQGWKFRLPTAEQQKQVIDAVSRFSCETLNLRAEPERDLFEKP